ncbi:NicO-domain-containing protein [Cutaneotrichosporon oleaginosum]|uniref:Nickel/cobalt efflux system n=1 Tax=Cutaneotrichosporon oleaginosum TaxID=879819 RepID=A0A0J0XMR9_9TREE|nr:NicO-domain-containing protein [Cutaneotrichosporon oleaginosum]KLT42391.1 NicO-domain-containing protein [Cutaneotrichosporon oleaginosum]TXT04210.1 hypothetical protein COLE_07907 [Cutaneotrichosporon oleaginosum]
MRSLSLRPTLVGRALLLVAGLVLANAAVWTAAGIAYRGADGLLGIAMLAWTLGLRHGLDADHISAIDNATRQMVSLGQLPMTCGLFFSLGHSTIVIVVNIALAISVDIYDRLGKVGDVGGIIGTSVSAVFLFLVAVINSYFLVGAVRARKRAKELERLGLPPDEDVTVQGGGCLVRIIGPILKAVDKPWKLYPVGILFGFGFDTASSIALLALSAIATRGPDGEAIAHGKIVILPFLFTAGMSLVDTLDSILMLYAYAQPELRTEGKLALFERDKEAEALLPAVERTSSTISEGSDPTKPQAIYGSTAEGTGVVVIVDEAEARRRRMLAAKTATMGSLSISLTLLSIVVALSISLIEILGLIGENCARCTAAAEAEDGGGLEGSWWRAWAAANDASGYVGAAIVGVFVVILLVYHGARWWWKKRGGEGRALVHAGV